jgi:hypothetical protein
LAVQNAPGLAANGKSYRIQISKTGDQWTATDTVTLEIATVSCVFSRDSSFGSFGILNQPYQSGNRTFNIDDFSIQVP